MATPESFRAVLDHQHDAGVDWPVEFETEMSTHSLDLSGKRILVIGLGDTGLSCARWLTAQGAEVSVADSRDAPPHALRLAELLPQVPLFTGPFDDARLQSADMLVVSPGVPLADPAIARAWPPGSKPSATSNCLPVPSARATRSATSQLMQATRCGSSRSPAATARAPLPQCAATCAAWPG
jgi:hypothetical protein